MQDPATSKAVCRAIALASRAAAYEAARAEALRLGNREIASFLALRIEECRRDARGALAKVADGPQKRA
ncbi:hypothetical protein [Labrys wisconsinensis]|uniref:Uncharacterized protein n=1 Tax=Labrys wisconsinensis TaxID=425677 RepID=A0ABU0J992_9HYPH|nr:hypothetical protein [Labrys wisconsinensis]MDQ0470846.1 hypothetical protein [Labrys wisconsinensis]